MIQGCDGNLRSRISDRVKELSKWTCLRQFASVVACVRREGGQKHARQLRSNTISVWVRGGPDLQQTTDRWDVLCRQQRLWLAPVSPFREMVCNRCLGLRQELRLLIRHLAQPPHTQTWALSGHCECSKNVNTHSPPPYSQHSEIFHL